MTSVPGAWLQLLGHSSHRRRSRQADIGPLQAADIGFPWTILKIPSGIFNFPLGLLNIPSEILNIPLGILNIPLGILNIPSGILNIPSGILNIPLGILSFPSGNFPPHRPHPAPPRGIWPRPHSAE